MRRWMVWLGASASATGVVAGAAACGESSTDDCTANGTCTVPDAAGDQVVLVDSNGGQADHVGNPLEGAARDGAGPGSDGSGVVADGGGTDASGEESGLSCDSGTSLMCGGQCVSASDATHC
ncbi:MAG TPA: hypothetical protein VKU41_05245, partial [Polyangiaceae bacterium]|nr:hypothetical protein [Polyangiaceae bacterium]